MSKEIMTIDEFFRNEFDGILHNGFCPETLITVADAHKLMQAYARYVIESLTDEDIRERAQKQYPKPVGSNEMGKVTGIIRGMKQAQQELLNRIK